MLSCFSTQRVYKHKYLTIIARQYGRGVKAPAAKRGTLWSRGFESAGDSV